MQIIQAKVNPRLLTKASRLFTGTFAGQVTEILQNARRAGATHVEITNRDGIVTVRDNGRGVRDFAALLDLGGSDWPGPPDAESLEASEDPAGVGLFCLAPRQVTVRSGGYIATITSEGWTGRVVEVQADPKPLPAMPPGIGKGRGTELRFADQPWDHSGVAGHAVFTGLHVAVDGVPCVREPFLRGKAGDHPELGCRVQVLDERDLSHWHHGAARAAGAPGFTGISGSLNVLVNFHGQVVGLFHQPLDRHHLWFLVDLTGAPTALRMMLPARTQLIEDPALEQLKAVLEREAFLHVQRQGQHRLPHQLWQRAKELGIELPEAEPTFQLGLLPNDSGPSPVQVVMPEGHKLADCYRLATERQDVDDTDEANLHLLSALGTLPPEQGRLIVVDIRSDYDGYGWANLPVIRKLELVAGQVLREDFVGSGSLICVDRLTLTAHAGDGKVFTSAVCMALKPWQGKGYGDAQVYVTPAAQKLWPSEIWHHLGGFTDEGDSYETQEHDFEHELRGFWEHLVGPDEPLRARLVEAGWAIRGKWRSVTLTRDGTVTIVFGNHRRKVLEPPALVAAPPES